MARRRQPKSQSEIFEGMRSDYRAAKESRFVARLTGVDPNGSGADYHIRNGYLKIIERARAAERNDPVIGAALTRLTSNVVGTGSWIDPQTGDPELDSVLADRFWKWASSPDSCHSEGEMSYAQIESMMFRSAVRDGDCFALLTDEGTIQVVEGHRLRTPNQTKQNVVHGVLCDSNGKRREIWVTREDIGLSDQTVKTNDVIKVPIRDESGERVVCQVMIPNRSSQRRGVSSLAPTTEISAMLDDVQFAMLVKQQFASLLVILRTQGEGAIPGPAFGGGPGTAGMGNGDGRDISPIPFLESGLDYRAGAGEKIEAFSPNIPGDSYFQHVRLLLQLIAINLGIPVQALLLDPADSSFSAWRSALEECKRRFRELQQNLGSQFHTPVWRWRVRWLLENDEEVYRLAARVGDQIYAHELRPIAWPYLDPETDAKAEALQLENILTSPRRLQGNRGCDWETIVKETIEDKMLLIKAAKNAADRLNQEVGLILTWEQVLRAGLPEKASVAKQPAANLPAPKE